MRIEACKKEIHLNCYLLLINFALIFIFISKKYESLLHWWEGGIYQFLDISIFTIPRKHFHPLKLSLAAS